MTTRRGFLATLLAAGSLPALSWADAGSPAYLAAAREPDGAYALFGLSAGGVDLFRIPLPARGHAASAHPTRPEAVAFARRPGTFALVIDCVTGAVIERLESPEGRHFMGHGEFIMGGEVLATAENAFEIGEGRIGLWSVREGYARIGEIASGGIGPHDLKRMPGSDVLAVANGGIQTRGRDKLNIDTMRPNLAYVDVARGVLEMHELAPELHQASIRHLALREDGLIGFAMQWEGDPYETVPLLGLHRRGEPVVLAEAPLGEQMSMKGYAGSIAFAGDGSEIAITSPRGGRVHRFATDGTYLGHWIRGDVCGLASAPGGYFASDGQGALFALSGERALPLSRHNRAWDNHVVAL